MKAPWRAPLARLGQRMREHPLTNLFLHFFRRLFAGEALSAETDLRLGMGGILMILSVPGGFLSILLLPKYSSLIRWITGQLQFDFNTASIPDKYMLLTLSMTITGIVAALKWDGLFPDRLDSVNMLTLPVTSRQILAGKLGALFAFVGLFIVALNGAATILFPLVVLGDQESVRSRLRIHVLFDRGAGGRAAYDFAVQLVRKNLDAGAKLSGGRAGGAAFVHSGNRTAGRGCDGGTPPDAALAADDLVPRPVSKALGRDKRPRVGVSFARGCVTRSGVRGVPGFLRCKLPALFPPNPGNDGAAGEWTLPVA
jgi:hypothetical protein